mmetsp:Transcript_4682/g.18713  ORF Transcript_4682/g.18713 Transcript_4682/m.18713 type:complete len:217 (-) Transcript_4682:41-691(-)|eukprot:scaffold757_cov246-Pinguiococcus_pyrenoidosus.AAC.4
MPKGAGSVSRRRSHLNRAHEAYVAHVDHVGVRRVKAAVQGIFQYRRHRSGIVVQPGLVVVLDHRDASGRGHGVAGVRVAMEELYRFVRSRAHDAVIDRFRGDDGSRGHDGAREALRGGDDVGVDVEIVHGKRLPEAPEARDDLIQDEENPMLLADGLYALQVAFRRDEDAGRASHGLHDDGRDVLRPMQRHQVFQLICQVGTRLRLPPGEGLLLHV